MVRKQDELLIRFEIEVGRQSDSMHLLLLQDSYHAQGGQHGVGHCQTWEVQSHQWSVLTSTIGQSIDVLVGATFSFCFVAILNGAF